MSTNSWTMMKYPIGFLNLMLTLFAPRWHQYSTLQFGKVKFLHCENRPTFYRFKKNTAQVTDDDLRPISLTPTISKILEGFAFKLVFEQIVPHIDRYQYGNMKMCFTTLALICKKICNYDFQLIYIYYKFKLVGNALHKFSLIYVTIDLNILRAVQRSQTHSCHLY
jgi:hypothetical protein